MPRNINIYEPTDDVNTLLNLSDYFISAPTRETFSFGIAEALAYGLPCIISDIRSAL